MTQISNLFMYFEISHLALPSKIILPCIENTADLNSRNSFKYMYLRKNESFINIVFKYLLNHLIVYGTFLKQPYST